MQTIYLFLVLSILLSTVASLSTDCLGACQECVQTKSSCLACKNEFQRSISGECLNGTIINCILYLNRLICSKCRPSHRLINNRCVKMLDGCLQSNQINLCSNCLQTSILDRNTSTCLLNQLNCQQLGRNRKCIKCISNYRLDQTKNICVYNSSRCSKTDDISGLCTNCINNFTLLGYECFRNERLSLVNNCYLAKENQISGNIQCIYCKQGFLLITGTCNPKSSILKVNQIQKCSEIQYVDIDNKCKSIPYQCRFFDYGFKQCVFCDIGKSFIGGLCKKDVHKNCLQFSQQNNQLCALCKPKYYLNQDSECMSFPPFCEQISRKKCVRCIDTFLLNKDSLCIDPNCLQVSQMNGQCLQCRNSFVKDTEGICNFVDPNCQQRRNSQCFRCKYYFQLNQKSGMCQYKDLNCKNLSIQRVCLECNQKFYYNNNVGRCLKLPQNCFLADDRGICRQCVNGFVLTTTRDCLRKNSIPNCKISSQKTLQTCSQCQNSYYVNLKGSCELLPLYCLQFDATKNICKVCNSSTSKLQDGICKDKNCQYLDFDGTCLGCYPQFQFGSLGQCVPQQKDPNCKEFQFNQCKKCSNGHYFDKQWKCIPVAPKCRQYDINSGLCTSCYQGYKLQEEPQGLCIQGNPTDSINAERQSLSECKNTNSSSGNCSECIQDYEMIKLKNDKISCGKISKVVQCSADIKTKKCLKCPLGTFLNKKDQCEQIDIQCKSYYQKAKQCLQCYPGYELQEVQYLRTNQNKTLCLLKIVKDPNCKTYSITDSNYCQECYSGYAYSSITLICQLSENTCQTKDKDSGKCLTCFKGYKLTNGNCIISTTFETDGTQVNSSDSCQKLNGADNTICDECAWGYLNLKGKCLKKDLNCKTFKQPNKSLECVECYAGYSIIASNPNKCIQQTKIDKNCQQYDQNFKCKVCNKGFKQIQTQGQQGTKIVTCQLIIDDAMCIVYNYDLKKCDKCIQNVIITQTGKCDYPLHGFDSNCLNYENKICIKCKQSFFLTNFFCILSS